MKRNKIKYLPFVLGLMLNIVSVAQTAFINNNSKSKEVLNFLNRDIFFGLIGMILTCHLLIVKKTYWKHVFIILLLIDNTIYISLFNFHFYFGFLGIGLDLIPIVLLFFHAFLHPNILDTGPFKYFKSAKKPEFLALTDSGFKLNSSNKNFEVNWDSINGITCFKIDQISVDCLYLNIEYGAHNLNVHEDLIGWNEFLDELHKRFPSIDENWRTKIIQPSFERNEILLFNRKKTKHKSENQFYN